MTIKIKPHLSWRSIAQGNRLKSLLNLLTDHLKQTSIMEPLITEPHQYRRKLDMSSCLAVSETLLLLLSIYLTASALKAVL